MHYKPAPQPHLRLHLQLNPIGILKLIDFGIAEFSSETSVSTSHGVVANTLPYCAPEVLVHRNREGVINSMNHIWSLGCVYLECVAWYYGGWAEVELFLNPRTTPDDDDPDFQVPTFFATERDPESGEDTGAYVKAEVVEVSLHLLISFTLITALRLTRPLPSPLHFCYV